MVAQFGQAPLASLPSPDLGNGAALTRPLLQAPHNLRLDGTLSLCRHLLPCGGWQRGRRLYLEGLMQRDMLARGLHM